VSDFVLDCSVTLSWVLPDEATPETDALLRQLSSVTAFAPDLWHLETMNALLQAERRGRLTGDGLDRRFALLRRLNVSIDAHGSRSAPAVLALARRHGLTSYDACYLELAIRLGLPLATTDRRLRDAATDAGVALLP